MAEKLQDLRRLESLELYDTTLTPEAWRELGNLSSLRTLKIRGGAVDFANLQRLVAGNQELTVDYAWPVSLSIWRQALAIDLPMVRVVATDTSPLAGFCKELTVEPAGSAKRVVKIPVMPPVDPSKLEPDQWCLTEGGGVCIVPPIASFLVSTDGSTLTIGEKSFPIAERKRTLVIHEDGDVELRQLGLRYNPAAKKFEGGEEVGEGTANTDGLTPEESQAEISTVQQAVLTRYRNSTKRSLTRITAPHGEDWVLDLSPAVRLLPSDFSGTVDFRPDPRGRTPYYPDIGISVLYKKALPSHVETSATFWFAKTYSERKGAKRWSIFVAGQHFKPVEVRALFFADEGELVCSLGPFSVDGDFRVDGNGRSLTVGDKTVKLTPGVATKIFLSGDKSKGEPLRLDRVATDEER
jgi:hypothetical protein